MPFAPAAFPHVPVPRIRKRIGRVLVAPVMLAKPLNVTPLVSGERRG